jgi:hypothetical protein
VNPHKILMKMHFISLFYSQSFFEKITFKAFFAIAHLLCKFKWSLQAQQCFMYIPTQGVNNGHIIFKYNVSFGEDP